MMINPTSHRDGLVLELLKSTFILANDVDYADLTSRTRVKPELSETLEAKLGAFGLTILNLNLRIIPKLSDYQKDDSKTMIKSPLIDSKTAEICYEVLSQALKSQIDATSVHLEARVRASTAEAKFNAKIECINSEYTATLAQIESKWMIEYAKVLNSHKSQLSLLQLDEERLRGHLLSKATVEAEVIKIKANAELYRRKQRADGHNYCMEKSAQAVQVLCEANAEYYRVNKGYHEDK